MLFDDPEVLGVLGRLITSLHVTEAEGEELRQEALVHLWECESRHPGQRRGWYVRGCWLHLRNVLRKGRSLDSQSHQGGWGRRGRTRCLHTGAGEVDGEEEATIGGVMSQVCADDLLAEIGVRLGPVERETLHLLAEGLTEREVARRQHVSHTAVAKRHRRIAEIARRLEAR